MSFNHININQLTNLEANYYLGVKARACAQRMKIGKDKVYRYYKLFMQGDVYKRQRQEVAVILTNIMNNKDTVYDRINTFTDGYKTSSWAKSSVEGAIEAGYLRGNEMCIRDSYIHH